MKNFKKAFFTKHLSPAVFKRVDESKMILELLGTKGIFLDIGANDPIVGSQTFSLESAGWTGICIEPQPKFAAKLLAERKSLVVQCACGSPEKVGEKIKLYALDSNAALHPERVLFGNFDQIRDVVEVELNTVDNILKSNNMNQLDFVTIDVEGYEMEVLSGFSISEWKPKLIFIEDHLYDFHVYRYFCARDYKLVRRTELNMWYVPNETVFPVSFYGRWQLFKKLYLSHPFRLWRKFVKGKLKQS